MGLWGRRRFFRVERCRAAEREHVPGAEALEFIGSFDVRDKSRTYLRSNDKNLLIDVGFLHPTSVAMRLRLRWGTRNLGVALAAFGFEGQEEGEDGSAWFALGAADFEHTVVAGDDLLADP